MQHKHAIEAVDQILRDVLEKNILFGGITVLFGGDFVRFYQSSPRGPESRLFRLHFINQGFGAQSRCTNLLKICT
jgi:PIF1-like helicase